MIVPGTFIINGEVYKDIHMPHLENRQLQFWREAYNMLNHPNWGAPNRNILSGASSPDSHRPLPTRDWSYHRDRSTYAAVAAWLEISVLRRTINDGRIAS
jgi:hypothetical protein